jgi:hypothetical protein
MMKPSDEAVVLIHELQRVSVCPRSALGEFRKTSELVSGLPVIREELVGTADSFQYADFPLVTSA